jgi:ATP-dependent DNA ligase
MNALPIIITRPTYGTCDLKAALTFNFHGWHLSEKADGICVRREFAGCSVWGDSMRDGRLMVWDIDRAFGQDVRRLPWLEREAALRELFSRLNEKLNWHRCATGNGAEFIEAVIAAGGEGCVAKPFDSPFGYDWTKIKRSETHDCIVTEKHASKLSVRLAENGIDRGWCAVLGGDYFGGFELDKISVGDVVEIQCYGITAKDKFREPRFLKIRKDKMEAA